MIKASKINKDFKDSCFYGSNGGFMCFNMSGHSSLFFPPDFTHAAPSHDVGNQVEKPVLQVAARLS